MNWLQLRREHRQRLTACHRAGAIQGHALLLHFAAVGQGNAVHARCNRCTVASRQDPGLRFGVGPDVERPTIANCGALRRCVSDPALDGAQLVCMHLDHCHRRPHTHLNLDATLERVASGVEVEGEVHAHRHHVFRQVTGHLVETEARLGPGGSHAEQQPDDCKHGSRAAGKPRVEDHDFPSDVPALPAGARGGADDCAPTTCRMRAQCAHGIRRAIAPGLAEGPIADRARCACRRHNPSTHDRPAVDPSFVADCLLPALPLRGQGRQQSCNPARVERPVVEAMTSTSRPKADLQREEFVAQKPSLNLARRTAPDSDLPGKTSSRRPESDRPQDVQASLPGPLALLDVSRTASPRSPAGQRGMFLAHIRLIESHLGSTPATWRVLRRLTISALHLRQDRYSLTPSEPARDFGRCSPNCMCSVGVPVR
jgi:hypothetical protein